MLLGAVSALALAACDPNLPPSRYRPGDGPGGAGGGGDALAVTPEPEAPLDAAPRVLRLRITAPPNLDPALVALVAGDIGPVQLRELGKGNVSSTLAKRIVPARAFRDGAALVIAPTVVLDAGERYTLALGEPRITVPVRVAPADPVPVLQRVWPPDDAVSARPFAVWCGDADLPQFEAPVRLDPGGSTAWIRRGVADGGAGKRCLRLDADPTAADPEGWVPPPLVTSADTTAAVRLSPTLLRAGAAAEPLPALACEADEIAFGPGCVRVADDRLFGRAPDVPLLWAVSGAGVDSVLTTSAGDPFAIAGLPPATDITLDVAAIDARGTLLRMLSAAVTATPMPHVILNEALADPLGAEPSAEWVEIVNDGQAPADLGGYTLLDGGGETVLPPVTLAPGAFALLVNEAFDEQACVEPCPAPGTLLVRVPHLGKNGLSNAGEPLTLRDGGGVTVSRLPASPKPKAGQSVARIAPAAPDGLAGSFALAEPSPGRTNVW